VDLIAVRASRENEQYVLDTRNDKVTDEYITDWKKRTSDIDNLYAGRLDVVFPNEVVEQLPPTVMNIVQIGLDETARLVSETSPQLRSEPASTSDEDILPAYKREAIGQTQWLANDGEDILVPLLALDIAATGLTFVAASKGDVYPTATVLDPRGCIPEFVNNKLVSLLVVTRYRARQLKSIMGEDFDGTFTPSEIANCAEAELLQWYDAKQVVSQVVLKAANSSAYAAAELPSKTWVHELGEIPVAWGRNPTADRAFRGLFDQIKGIFLSQNRIFQLQVDYADQQVYSPWLAVDIENDTDPPGPTVIYRGRSEMSKMERVSPGGSNPGLFNLLEYLERQARGGAAYPQQRQGEVGQSIASASFVHSTLGQLTTQIKFCQKQIGFLRQNLHRIFCKIERRWLDESKPLLIASGRFGQYKPSEDLREVENFRIIYGAGAGLDALNKKQAIQMDVSSGISSLETAMEQTDYITDVSGEKQKRQKELVENALLQRMVTDPNIGIDLLMRVAEILSRGHNVIEAAAMLASLEEAHRNQEQAAATAAAAGPPGAGGGSLPAGQAPPTTADQYAAAQATPPPGSQVTAPPPHISNIAVRTPQGG